MGIVLDVVPNHMAADDANRYWADPSLRERILRPRPGTGGYRRFFDIDELAGVRQEDPEVFEETHELVLATGPRGAGRWAPGRPPGRAGRSRRVPRAAARATASSACGSRRSSIPASGCATGRCAAPSATSSSTTSARCSSIPPAKPALTALWEQVSGDRRAFGEVAHEAKLEQVRGPFAPRRRAARTRARRRSVPGGLDALGHALASLPVYRTYVDPGAAGSTTPIGA